MTTTHHQIDFGESLRWEPSAGTAEFYVWGKRTADNSIMRWKRVAGYSRSHRHESQGAGIVGEHHRSRAAGSR